MTDAQAPRLEAALGAALARFVPRERSAKDPSDVRLVGGQHLTAKLGISVALGGGALALAVPIVPVASALMCGLLAFRAVRFETKTLVVAASQRGRVTSARWTTRSSAKRRRRGRR